jgi:hypothetical protein
VNARSAVLRFQMGTDRNVLPLLCLSLTS